MTNREKKLFKKIKQKEESNKKKLLKRREAARTKKKADNEVYFMQREIEKIQNKASQIRKDNQCKTLEDGTQI